MKLVLFSALILSLVIFSSWAGESPDTGAKTLKKRIDVFSLTVTIRPTQLNQGLQSVLLYTNPSMRVEPHGVCPNGEPISADANISPAEALKLIDVLEENGFFTQARNYYSERTHVDSKKIPPPS